MRPVAALLLAATLAACAITPTEAPGPSNGIPLLNASFETPPANHGDCPPGWNCATHAANKSHRYRMESGGTAGAAAGCTDRLLKARWALLPQHVRAESRRGARVRLSVARRVAAAATAPGAGPFLLAEAIDSSTVLHEEKQASRTAGWQRMAVEGVVPEKAWRLQVGVV